MASQLALDTLNDLVPALSRMQPEPDQKCLASQLVPAKMMSLVCANMCPVHEMVRNSLAF
jgi:hypothetical protein